MKRNILKKPRYEFYSDAFDPILSQITLKLREEERLEFRANILLIIAGVLGIAFLSLNIISWNEYQIFSFVPLGILYLISLNNIASAGNVTPWVDKSRYDKLLKSGNSSKIKRSLINQFYDLTGPIDKELKRKRIWVWESLFLIYLTIVWTIVIYITHSQIILMIVFLILISYITFTLVYYYYLKHRKKTLKIWLNMNPQYQPVVDIIKEEKNKSDILVSKIIIILVFLALWVFVIYNVHTELLLMIEFLILLSYIIFTINFHFNKFIKRKRTRKRIIENIDNFNFDMNRKNFLHILDKYLLEFYF